MQGAFELGLVVSLFLGLQIWWIGKVLLNRQQHPRPTDALKATKANSLRNERNALERTLDQS